MNGSFKTDHNILVTSMEGKGGSRLGQSYNSQICIYLCLSDIMTFCVLDTAFFDKFVKDLQFIGDNLSANKNDDHHVLNEIFFTAIMPIIIF